MQFSTAMAQYFSSQFEVSYRELWQRFCAPEWVSGLDIGLVTDRQSVTDAGRLALRLHVHKPHTKHGIDPQWLAALPQVVNGLPLQVVEGRYQSRIEAMRPALPSCIPQPQMMSGVSLGRLSGATGTAGVIVMDGETGRPGVLSSWQVLAGGKARMGDPIVHPGLAEVDVSHAEHVATLMRWMCDEDGDGAFALLEGGHPFSPSLGVTDAPVNAVKTARVGDMLRRFGRWGVSSSGGVTLSRDMAQVDGVGMYRVQYETSPGVFRAVEMRGARLSTFEECGATTGARSAAAADLTGCGHQGALWGQDDQTGMGLQVAQSADSVIVSHLDPVLRRLNLSLAQATPVEPHVGRVADFLQHCKVLERQRAVARA